MIRLTKTIVENSVYAGTSGKDIRWDSEVPGLGLRIHPSGSKAFVISYRTNGRKRLMVLGKVGVLSLDDARRDARIKLTSVICGQDPLADRIRQQSSQTVGALVTTYMNQYSKQHKKSWKLDERRLAMYVVPAWENQRVSSITTANVIALHQKIGALSGKISANRVIELLRSVFEFGKTIGFLELNAINPAKAVPRFKEKARERWLSEEELIPVAAAIQNEPNIYARSAILLYLLVGARKSELLNAKWSDVNLNRRELRLGQTKNGSDHYVPLSPTAIAVLNDIPRIEGNPYIICGSKPGERLVNIRKPWLRIRAEAGVHDVTIHDLRRTCGSMLANSGCSLHLIGQVLNHRDSDSTKIYARIGQSSVRAALDSHGEQLQALIGSGGKLLNLTAKKIVPV